MELNRRSFFGSLLGLLGLGSTGERQKSLDQIRCEASAKLINPTAILSFKDDPCQEPLTEAEIERIKTKFEEAFTGTCGGKLFVVPPGCEIKII